MMRWSCSLLLGVACYASVARLLLLLPHGMNIYTNMPQHLLFLAHTHTQFLSVHVLPYHPLLINYIKRKKTFSFFSLAATLRCMRTYEGHLLSSMCTLPNFCFVLFCFTDADADTASLTFLHTCIIPSA